MLASGFRRWVQAAVLAALTPFMIGGASPVGNWQERVLASHNRERDAADIPPLEWDATLARDAQDWAVELARTGGFHHAPERTWDPEGENLWAGTKGYFTSEAMVGAWIREKRYFRAGRFPDNSTTGRFEDVGHYTQLMWRDSRTVGCAMARSREEDLLVCRYKQAGNYRGDVPF